MASSSSQDCTVVYRLFVLTSCDFDNLLSRYQRYAELVSPWVLSYPWYNERFHLDIVPTTNNSSNAAFKGSVNFGECIEDEWFIVWLLGELTKDDPDLFIQVEDDDGEFLLIELAESLPKWINPDNSANRVWLCNGQLGLIVSDRGKPISLCTALSELRKRSVAHESTFRLMGPVQNLFQRRIKDYPAKVHSEKQVAHVLLPYAAAALLSLPIAFGLVGSATTSLAASKCDLHVSRKMNNRRYTFFATGYNREETCVHQSHWPNLQSTAVDYFLRPCSFSRLQYARLMSLPVPTVSRYPRVNSSASDRLATELGIKLCVGLDLLLCTKTTPGEPSLLPTGVPDGCAAWHSFFDRLQTSGYLKDTSCDSGLQDSLISFARLYFDQYDVNQNVYKSGDIYNWVVRNPKSALTHLLNAIEAKPSLVPSPERMLTEESNLPPPDDTSWMYITPDELDSMWAAHTSGEADASANDEVSLADKLDNFIHDLSSFEGIEVRPKSNVRNSALKRGHQSNVSELTDSDTVSTWSDDISDDSEDGYNEQLPANKVSGESAESVLTMANMMQSLMCNIDESFLVGKPKTQHLPVPQSRPVLDEVVHSSSEDDIADMYSPGSDVRCDYGEQIAESSRSESDSDVSSDAERQLQCRQDDVCSCTDKRNRSVTFSVNQVPQQDVSSCSQTSDYSDDEEPTAGEAKWYKQSGSSNNDYRFSDPPSKTIDRSFLDYLAAMERELSNQPANYGRFAPSNKITYNRKYHTKISANRIRVSSRKKSRQEIRKASIAVPDDDIEFNGSENRNSVFATSALADHVVSNLCASALPLSESGPPTGPAAQILNALGVPINRLTAAVVYQQANNRRSASDPD